MADSGFDLNLRMNLQRYLDRQERGLPPTYDMGPHEGYEADWFPPESYDADKVIVPYPKRGSGNEMVFSPFIKDAEVTMAPTRLRDRIHDYLLPILGKGKASDIAGLASFLPGTGDVEAVEDVALGLKDDDYLQAGIGAAGFLPFGGVLKKLFHGTTKAYQRPFMKSPDNPREIGYHVGTLQAAHERLPQRWEFDTMNYSKYPSGAVLPDQGYVEGANIRPVTVDIKNPYPLGEDLGVFTPDRVLNRIIVNETERPGLSKLKDDAISLADKWKTNKKYKPYWDYKPTEEGLIPPEVKAATFATSKKMAQDLNRVLKRNKFDIIEYTNQIEDAGKSSYMILDPRDIVEEGLAKKGKQLELSNQVWQKKIQYKLAPQLDQLLEKHNDLLVDAKGKPIVLFHATSSHKVFDEYAVNPHFRGFVSTTTNPNFASNWIGDIERYIGRDAEQAGGRVEMMVAKGNIFNYKNPDHVKQLENIMRTDLKEKIKFSKEDLYRPDSPWTADVEKTKASIKEYKRQLSEDIPRRMQLIKEGDWSIMEANSDRLYKLNFDGFTTREGGLSEGGGKYDGQNVMLFNPDNLIPIFDPDKVLGKY